MAIIKVVLSLLKKQKVYSVTIFCLAAVVALMISTALTVIKRSGEIHDAALDNSSSPDIFLVFDEDEHELSEQFKDMEGVKSIKEIPGIHIRSKSIDLNSSESSESIFFFSYEQDFYRFRFKYTGKDLFYLNEGEVIFPLFYEGYHSLKIGDTVKIEGHDFKIADFYEDPLFGSSTIGTRRAFVNGADFEKICNGNQEYQIKNVCVYTDINRNSTNFPEELSKVESNINRGETGYSITVLEVKNYAMLISKLVSAVLLAFALLSLLITLYVLRYAVLSSIEGNFATLGVFKAIGFKGGQIRAAIMLQYAFICLIGSLLGVTASIPVIPILGGLLLDSAGLMWSGGMWILGGVLVIIAAVTLICAITWFNTHRIKKISPVRAIAFGRAPVYFAKRMNISLQRLSFLPLHMRMALKQMLTRRKQYLALIIITVLLTFMTAFTGGVAKLFTDDKNVMHVFGFPNEDLTIGITNKNLNNEEMEKELNRIITEIESDYKVEKVYEQYSVSTTVDGEIVWICAYENFDGIGLTEPLSGRFPKYDNELALSPVTSRRYNKDIGDTVYIDTLEGGTAEYIVTGIVQNMSEVGQNLSITTAGIKRAIPTVDVYMRSVIFNKDTDKKDIEADIAQIKADYEDGNIFVSVPQDWLGQMLDSIRSVIDPAAGISYGLAVVLIALITFLLAMIAIYRENTDIGIFKSTGFTSKQLRLQFALRFLAVSLTGGLIGLIMTLLASNALVSFIFSFFGIPRVSMQFNLLDLLLPIALICFIALVSGWIVSGRIRRISGRTLISE